jgi:hypothetical protein
LVVGLCTRFGRWVNGWICAAEVWEESPSKETGDELADACVGWLVCSMLDDLVAATLIDRK